MKIRVLLVDDHAVIRDGLHFLLEAQTDITVVGSASEGQETVNMVREVCPDIVIMDIAMPKLNGIEATRLVCEACPSTQVIMLSVHATSEHIFRALQAGARGYLLKETAGIEIVDAVRAVHLGRPYLSEQIVETVIDDYIGLRQANQALSPIEKLSPREREVLQHVVEGKSTAEISHLLSLSPGTVSTYRSRLMQKLGVEDYSDLLKFAIQHGITTMG